MAEEDLHLKRNFDSVEKTYLSKLTGVFPDSVIEATRNIYQESVRRKLTVGRKIEDVLLGSLYLGARVVSDYEFFLEDLINSSGIDVPYAESVAYRYAVKILSEGILKKLDYKISDKKIPYNKIKKELNLDDDTVTLVRELADDLNGDSKKIYGYVAAFIYLLGKNDKCPRVKQDYLANYFGITEVTIRTRLRELEVKYPNLKKK